MLIPRTEEPLVFIGETERGKRHVANGRKSTVMFDVLSDQGLLAERFPQSSRYLAGCFHVDMTGMFEMMMTDGSVAVSNSNKNITSTLQVTVAAGHNSQWLILIRPQGIMEVRLTVYLGFNKVSRHASARSGPSQS